MSTLTRVKKTPPVQQSHRKKRPRSQRAAPLQLLILGLLAVYAGGPLIVFLFNALKSPAEISESPLGLPAHWRWENFAQAWTDAGMGQGLLNSSIISISTALGVCIIASMAAYSLTKLPLPGSDGWILALLISSSLPIQMFLVPLLSTWSNLGLYNTRFGLILIYWAVYSPFATLLLRSFLIQIPHEYIEAARLDGASEIRLFTRVVVPMIWPGILTAGLVAGLQAYNEFLLAVTFIQDSDRLPVSLSLFSFQQNFSPNWALVSAAGIIMALPVIIVFVFLQRRFIEGYTQGGLAN